MLELSYKPGLKFPFDYFMDFFVDFQSTFARAEKPSPVAETGVGFSFRAENHPLSFQEDFFQSPGWNLSPADRAEIRHAISPLEVPAYVMMLDSVAIPT